MDQLLPLPPPPCAKRFLWLLPVVFAVLCGLGCVWPGPEWRMFSIGALAGLWVALVLGDAVSHPLLPCLIGGMLTMGLFGWMLDRLRVSLWPWLLATPVAAAIAAFGLLQGHADIDAALAACGGVMACGVCAAQLGSYAAVLVALGLGAGRTTSRSPAE